MGHWGRVVGRKGCQLGGGSSVLVRVGVGVGVYSRGIVRDRRGVVRGGEGGEHGWRRSRTSMCGGV